MDQIKEAFSKVKDDITSLKAEIDSLNKEILGLKELINQSIVPKNIINEVPTIRQTNQQTTPTQTQVIPTHSSPFKLLKAQNLTISTGNRGVPTDRQTNQQTNQQTQNSLENKENGPFPENSRLPKNIDNAFEILNSLDSLKKEIRLKFKALTDQEFLVFSTLYQLEEESGFSDYKTLSEKLGLSESSIRDYIGKIIKKEIPVEKIKVNNKMIQLKVSQNLKKIASLPTILQLRDL